MTSFLLTIWLFDLPILTAITLIYLLVFWGLLYRLLLFWKAGKLEDNTSDEVSSFYEYTVAQIKHEEALRKEFTLQVSDNGTGFSRAPDENTLHHGLTSIQEQVVFLNGKMTIRANPVGGTNISILIPMKGEESYASFVGR